ncbi:MAG: pyridoxine 5'-phosphate synthase [Lysobacterales bacterium]|jgi:pyridoxine 5-phosphate synthase|nr:MAG: pyridoxine 5'-phosphate synthase [Xanthomonadales bacterium]
MTRLSVNVNKIAVLRNSRGGRFPDPIEGARVALAAGADGITVHPRPDRRHIRAEDVQQIAELLRAWPEAELNIEGNPFAPPRPGYPGLLALVETARPRQVTLVPDAEGQLTSDHGFLLPAQAERLAEVVPRFKALGARVSVFVDADRFDRESARAARAAGVDAVELYTGPYAEAFARGEAEAVIGLYVEAAAAALGEGLRVHAGHDLDQGNLGLLLARIPAIAEVSIGHALIGEALLGPGLAETVRRYRAIIRAACSSAAAPR